MAGSGATKHKINNYSRQTSAIECVVEEKRTIGGNESERNSQESDLSPDAGSVVLGRIRLGASETASRTLSWG